MLRVMVSGHLVYRSMLTRVRRIDGDGRAGQVGT